MHAFRSVSEIDLAAAGRDRQDGGVNKRFRVCELDQPFLLPPSLQEWLPENHLARFIAEVTNELDLSALYRQYERRDGRGLSAYHPLLLTRLLLYGYCSGVTSSRTIERATWEQIPFRYLAADQHPDHDTLAHFRRQHLEALGGLFVQALQLCQKAGLVKLGTVAIDGTKMLANASPSRSVPPAKLSERERYWQATVERLLAEAEAVDAQEDRQWGKGRRGDELPAELAEAQSRLERLRRAKAELEEEACQRLEVARASAPRSAPRKRGRPRKAESAQRPCDPQQRELEKTRQRKVRRAEQSLAQPTRQYNFVDPDSRVMRDNARKCFVQAYNAQLAVDAEKQVIVAAEITQEQTDDAQLLPMLASLHRTAGSLPAIVVADAGYWDTISLCDPSLAGLEVLVCPDSTPPSADYPPPPKAPMTEAAVRMRERLRQPEQRTQYDRRKITVEPVFGQIKEARGIRRFRFRGLRRVAQEWKLICATHNLLKLFRHRSSLPAPA